MCGLQITTGVQSTTRGAGFGSLAVTSVLNTGREGGRGRGRARHGDPHYREHQRRETSTNSIASIFAWRGASPTAPSSTTIPELANSPNAGESLHRTVEAGDMTKDLALLFGPDQKWLSTTAFSTRSRRTSPSDGVLSRPLATTAPASMWPTLVVRKADLMNIALQRPMTVRRPSCLGMPERASAHRTPQWADRADA